MRSGTWIIGGIVILLVVIGLGLYAATHNDQASARSLVENFGKQLQHVSLLSSDASSAMATAYGPYVDQALLLTWQKHPQQAPGRLTSSPWPDHIEIASMTPQGKGYIVQAAVMMQTSAGSAGFVPVMLQVVPESAGWRIAGYQVQNVGTTTHQ